MTNTAVAGGGGHVSGADGTTTSSAVAPAEGGDSAASQSATGSTGTAKETPAALPSADPTERPTVSETPSTAIACSESTSTAELGLTRYGNPRTVPGEAAGDGDRLNADAVTTDGTSQDAPVPAHTTGKGSKAANTNARNGVRWWGEEAGAFGVQGREQKV